MTDQIFREADMERIEMLFRSKASHQYVSTITGEMSVNKSIIYFLLDIMQQVELDSLRKEEQIVAALMVNGAFDTHEHVQIEPVQSALHKKKRQLTILAGDYHWSLYYSMLAHQIHAPILKVFSSSIQQINEEKMRLHLAESKDRNDFIKRLETVESGFLQNIAFYYGQRKTAEAANTFFMFKRLNDELQVQEQQPLSAFMAAVHAYWTNDVEASLQEDAVLGLEELHWLQELRENYFLELQRHAAELPETSLFFSHIKDTISQYENKFIQ